MATKPAMEPEQKPKALHFLSNLQSQSIQVNPPTEAAGLVTMHARAARRLVESAEPPLKPNWTAGR